MSGLFPAMLDLRGRPCVVIGGGAVAARKARRLARAGAQVRVIAPSFSDELRELAADGAVELAPRPYQSGDLQDARFVFVATSDPTVNAAALAEARAQGALANLANLADEPDGGDFQVPSTVERGGLTIAISTGGRSPAFARRLREQLEAWLTPERLELLELYAELRGSLKQEGAAASGPAWASVDESALQLLKDGRREEAERLLRRQVLVGAAGEAK